MEGTIHQSEHSDTIQTVKGNTGQILGHQQTAEPDMHAQQGQEEHSTVGRVVPAVVGEKVKEQPRVLVGGTKGIAMQTVGTVRAEQSATQQMENTAVSQQTNGRLSQPQQSQQLNVERDSEVWHGETAPMVHNGAVLSSTVESNTSQDKDTAFSTCELQVPHLPLPPQGLLPIGIPNLGASALEGTLPGREGVGVPGHQQKSPEHASMTGKERQGTTTQASTAVCPMEPAMC